MDTERHFTRRQALRWAGTAGLIGAARPRLKASPHDAVAKIEPMGILCRDCTLRGETRADDVAPSHLNGIQVSADRWLLLYSTRGYRGIDDDLSIIYQLRAGSPDGRIIREGFLAQTRNDWDALGDGNTHHIKQHGHPVAFGVPRGALIGGRPAAHANVFVAKWRKVARDYDPVRNYVPSVAADYSLDLRSQTVEWAQFRLNPAENDIEIIQPVAPLRQKGYETGPNLCQAPVAAINESFVQAVPFNREATEWADCCYFLDADAMRSSIAAMKYVFHPRLGRYEWTEMGPLLSGGLHAPVIPANGGRTGMNEPSLVRWRDQWIIAARGGPRGGSTWFRTDDLFGRPPEGVNPDRPLIGVPMTAYAWEDGQLRLFSGDPTISPHRNGRDPLYCWDIDPDRGFLATNRRLIFDSVAAGLPFRPASGPKVDLCELLPGQGRTQLLAYRVSIRAANHPYVGASGLVPGIPIANAAEKAACAVYYSKITYHEAFPPRWNFPRQSL